MWTLILVFLSCLILPQNSSCIETESCLENVLKRLQDLENRVSVQDSVIEELRKTTATLRDSNDELRETNSELQETNAKLRATNDKLHAAHFQLVETNKELRNAYLHLSEANAELREAGRMNHKLTSLKGSPAFKPAKRFVLNTEGPVAFTAAILRLVIGHLKTNDIVKFETVITDIGGGYNNQSGVFVAPVTGIYMFSCSLMEHYEMVSSGVMVNAEIVQSQRVLGRIFAGSYHDQGAQTVFTHVNQGDQIWVRIIDNQTLGLGGELYSTFSGYLLFAM